MPDPQASLRPKKIKGYQLIEGIRSRASEAFTNVEFLKANNIPIPDKQDAREEAKAIFLRDPEAKPAPTSPSAANYLKDLMDQYDFDALKHSRKLRSYVVTRLVEFSQDDNKHLAMKALTALGNIKDVGLFSTTIEVNITQKPTEDLEEELKGILKGYNMDVIEGQLIKVEGQLSLEREMLDDDELEGDFDD